MREVLACARLARARVRALSQPHQPVLARDRVDDVLEALDVQRKHRWQAPQLLGQRVAHIGLRATLFTCLVHHLILKTTAAAANTHQAAG